MPGETLSEDQTGGRLDEAIRRAAAALLRYRRADGHFVFPLEADATVPAEYVLLEHYLDRIEPALERKIGVHLRAIQGAHGGWPLFHGGALDISASVKAYFALKAIGDAPEAPHMRRAREAILAAGGAERANVFTRGQLALFGAVPWRAAPVMPVEIMLLPRWFFFHISKVSYWSRTVMVPLFVLMALKPRARNPRCVTIEEIFCRPPETIRDWIRAPDGSFWGKCFVALDGVLQRVEKFAPQSLRRRAIGRAVSYVTERLNGENGLGGIYPAMANAVMMFDALGRDDEGATAWASVRKLLLVEAERAWCQPCVSPVWDTGLAGHALAEAGEEAAVGAAAAWLAERQVTGLAGDWAAVRPAVRPGGWAFQYANPHFPDVDDTAVVGMLLHRTGDPAYAEAIARAAEWIVGMQSEGGGWGAFDADNTHYVLNHIPFADHGALLDPPTADVTARCVSFLAQAGQGASETVLARALAFLEREQEEEGSWFGRWGTNYIYGTWSVLAALNAAGVPHEAAMVRRAVAWLLSCQREDGGWGEDCETYGRAPHGRYRESTPSHTAWAVLGLMAAGEAGHEAVSRGIGWLVGRIEANGEWREEAYNAVGFPRVFYLHYHGYRLYFPLLALARFSDLARRGGARVGFGL
ncbi:MAG TPA: squalene--hopene cyclase [Acetobacteraceae bacterium]|nr:squalene--hopene cyclase [Acetobacteraceae bacterium]